MNRAPLYLVGPTASGKSALAVELALRLGGEIVNADAFQLYEGMDLCTAKPGAGDLALVPHHIFGIIPPGESCDAQRFSELAQPVIAEIASRDHLPIVVGGSGLYVKSLTHGLAPLPSSRYLRDKLAHLTPHERIAWLIHRDPAAASSVNLKNDRHVTRALEICLLTSQPQSELRQSWREQIPSFRGFRLTMDRAELNARIDRRVLRMIDDGLVEEIRTLPLLSETAERAIGIREIRTYLDGQVSLPEAVAALQLATRQYARRQEKWFKRETGFVTLPVREGVAIGELADQALALLPGLGS